MRIKFLEKMKFKFAGRSVPVIKCEDIDTAGRVHTLHMLGGCKDRPNSIIATWDSKGWEKDPMWGSPITLIDEKGIQSLAYVASEEGVTVPLFTRPSAYPNREDVIGRASTMDDISDAMDLGKSMRNMIIGVVIGTFIGWLLIAPMMTTALS